MRIAFFAEHCIPIHARSLDERPLGGTETALIRLAELLDRRGHDVTVFTAMAAPPPSKPKYLPSSQVLNSGRFEVFVLVQDWTPAFLGAPGERIFYWTGDGWDQYANFGIGDKRVPSRIEYLLAVSEWHANTLSARSGFPLDQVRIIGNGAHLPFFEGAEERRRKRLIYTAAPYRGLRLVPELYEALRRKHPELELHVFSGMNIYDREKPFEGPYVSESRKLHAVLEQLPGVTLHGNVTQRQLARELMKSSVFIYPNVIFETCCITAIEAQAAGCPVVASAISALPETVGDAGVVIQGEPGSPEYMRAFVAAVDGLLSDTVLWERYSHRALIAAEQKYSWERVADRFEALL
ncbi:MAG: glycosyltransferase family 4 protein [Bdellovibrionales bacterium]|nr:glycosyltransferase family 4 protein [Bdellovibrionales bacterium]